jgi:pSer/pThr/pTyr-binding forkhead associated (FHA) protein
MPEIARHQHTPAELKAQLEVERLGQPFLVYRDGAAQQQIVELRDHDRLVVGRGPGSDIGLDWDPDVSRTHAELERVGREWTLIDDGLSRNGTFVNGDRIHGRRRLVEGDRLRFGKTAVVFRNPVGRRVETTLASTDVMPAAKLTDAQRRVMVALARPFLDAGPFATPATNREIAAELFLSIDGVKTHIRTLFEKFNVEQLPQNQKRSRLVDLAFQSGAIKEADLRD